jgi:hypothetical protein
VFDLAQTTPNGSKRSHFTDPPALSALGFHLQNTNKHQQGASSVEYAHHVACDGNPVLVRLKGTAYILPSLPLPLAYI